MVQMLKAALEIAEKGTPVFPCLEKAIGRVCEKSSYIKDVKPSIDLNVIQNWWTKYPQAAIAIPAGKQSGITVVDLTIDNGRKMWESIVEQFEYEPYQTKEIKSPSGGTHLYFKYNKNVSSSKNRIAHGINTLGDNDYIIVPPSRTSSGDYKIIQDRPSSIIPPFISDTFVVKHAENSADITNCSVTVKSIRRILDEIPNTCLYETWRKVGLSLYGWDYEKGFDLWRRWSNKVDANACRRQWSSFVTYDGKLGLGSLIWLAQKENPSFNPTLNSNVQARENGGNHRGPNYKDLGNAFLDNNWTYDDGLYTLKNWKSEFYKYDQGLYKIVEKTDIKAEVMSHLQDSVENPTSYMLTEVLCNIDSNKFVNINSIKRPPCVLSSNKEIIAHRLINFNNGFFDLTNFLNKGEVKVLEHTPDLFSLIKIPYSIDSEAKCPEWEKAMSLYLDGDEELIKLTQMLCGYCLTPNRKYNIIAFLYGEGGTAKSTVLDVLMGIVGVENTSKLTLNELTDRFSKVELTTKLINITSETEVSGDLRINEAVIKTMTDGSSIYVEEKNKQGHVADVTAQLLIAANTMPTITDKSMGMWRRMVVIPFNKVLSGTSDVKIDFAKHILELEAPGIIMWMLRGLKELMKHDEFPKPGKVKDIVNDMREETDKERTFLMDYYEEVEENITFASTLYEHYQEDMEAQHHNSVLGPRKFYDMVLRTFKNVVKPKARKKRKGERMLSYVFVGLKKKNDMTVEDENQ